MKLYACMRGEYFEIRFINPSMAPGGVGVWYEIRAGVCRREPVHPANGGWIANWNYRTVSRPRSPDTDRSCAFAELPPRACDGSLTTLGPGKDLCCPAGRGARHQNGMPVRVSNFKLILRCI